MPISTVKILKGLTTGLCLSGFELFSLGALDCCFYCSSNIYLYLSTCSKYTTKLLFRELSAKLFSLFVI